MRGAVALRAHYGITTPDFTEHRAPCAGQLRVGVRRPCGEFWCNRRDTAVATPQSRHLVNARSPTIFPCVCELCAFKCASHAAWQADGRTDRPADTNLHAGYYRRRYLLQVRVCVCVCARACARRCACAGIHVTRIAYSGCVCACVAGVPCVRKRAGCAVHPAVCTAVSNALALLMAHAGAFFRVCSRGMREWDR